MDRQWLIQSGDETKLSDENILVYPNPFTGILKVYMSLSGIDVSLVLYDSKGNRVFSQTVQPDFNTVRLDLSNLRNGLYILRITGAGNEVVIRKIVKSR
jgi:hypothetical protein